jgi:hypothetical protein
MVKHTVIIHVAGANQFQADLEIDEDDFDPDTPPPHLTGTFTRFSGYEQISRVLVHTDRFDGGFSHKMYLFGGRCGYRFTMIATCVIVLPSVLKCPNAGVSPAGDLWP